MHLASPAAAFEGQRGGIVPDEGEECVEGGRHPALTVVVVVVVALTSGVWVSRMNDENAADSDDDGSSSCHQIITQDPHSHPTTSSCVQLRQTYTKNNDNND